MRDPRGCRARRRHPGGASAVRCRRGRVRGQVAFHRAHNRPPAHRGLEPGYDPPGYLASFRSFARATASAPWKPVFPAWQTEIGSGELRDVRREGDHATPTGVYGFGPVMYGTWPDPGGLHEPYHRLVCGDWWDEDPYSAQYNRFVHVACGTTPPFAAWSEPLWEETQGDRGYPYLAVIDYNDDPTVSGPDAPGSGIFLHAWMDAPTEGCLALPIPELFACCAGSSLATTRSSRSGRRPRSGRVPPLSS